MTEHDEDKEQAGWASVAKVDALIHHHTELPKTAISRAQDGLVSAIGRITPWSWLVEVEMIIYAVIGSYGFGQGSVTPRNGSGISPAEPGCSGRRNPRAPFAPGPSLGRTVLHPVSAVSLSRHRALRAGPLRDELVPAGRDQPGARRTGQPLDVQGDRRAALRPCRSRRAVAAHPGYRAADRPAAPPPARYQEPCPESLKPHFVIGMFATFGALLMTGFPVAWTLSGVAVIWTMVGPTAAKGFGADLWFDYPNTMALVPERTPPLVGSETLVVLPMFIFMGIMLDQSGVAERLVNNTVKLLGTVRRGYAVTVIVIGVLLAATTGIIGASKVLPTAALILGVLGSILASLTIPDEASGVSAAWALLLAALSRRLNLRVLRESLEQTTRAAALIFATFLGATAFSVVLRGLKGTR